MFINPPNQMPEGAPPAVVAIDGVRMISFTVLLRPNSDGSTTLILGEVNIPEPHQRLDHRAPISCGFGCHHLRRGRNARAQLPGERLPQAQIESFYADVLGHSGYQRTGPGQFVRGTELLTVATEASDAGPTRVLVTADMPTTAH